MWGQNIRQGGGKTHTNAKVGAKQVRQVGAKYKKYKRQGGGETKRRQLARYILWKMPTIKQQNEDKMPTYAKVRMGKTPTHANVGMGKTPTHAKVRMGKTPINTKVGTKPSPNATVCVCGGGGGGGGGGGEYNTNNRQFLQSAICL